MSASDPDPSPRRLVQVFSAPASEGLLVKGLLEAEGIPVVTKGEASGPYRVGTMDLWVPEEFETHARMILEDARSAAPEEESDPSAWSTEEPSGPS